MAMRKHYWNDSSVRVQQEKQALKYLLEHQQIFPDMQEEDLKYFSLVCQVRLL
jgi:hypothetical protein